MKSSPKFRKEQWSLWPACQGCSQPQCLLYWTGMVAVTGGGLEWKPATSLPESADLVWSRAENSFPAALSGKAATQQEKGETHSPAGLGFWGQWESRQRLNKDVGLEMRSPSKYKKSSPRISDWLGKLHVWAQRKVKTKNIKNRLNSECAPNPNTNSSAGVGNQMAWRIWTQSPPNHCLSVMQTEQ